MVHCVVLTVPYTDQHWSRPTVYQQAKMISFYIAGILLHLCWTHKQELIFKDKIKQTSHAKHSHALTHRWLHFLAFQRHVTHTANSADSADHQHMPPVVPVVCLLHYNNISSLSLLWFCTMQTVKDHNSVRMYRALRWKINPITDTLSHLN